MIELSRTVQVALAVASVVVFVGTLLAIPVLVVRMPEDFFVRLPPRHSLAVRTLRVAVGLAVVALGVMMLVLPGQGILTILVGLGILGLPATRRLARKLLCLASVRDATNRLRARYGKPPLIVPHHEPGFA